MKKLYSLLFVLFFVAQSVSFAQVPTCNYDFTWLATGHDGIFPDSATNFMSGNVGTPYVQNITVKIPYDTVTGAGTFHFGHVDLMRNVTSPANYGLPPGLSIGTTAPNVTTTASAFKFPGNDTSCMTIYGTPTTAGTYNMAFTLKTFMVETGNLFPASTTTLLYYRIVINSPIGVNENGSSKFELGNAFPNPANTNATIKFVTPKPGNAKFTVYNTLGKIIISKSAETKAGDNEFDLNTANLASGIYVYSVEFEGKTITKKLIVSKD